VRVNAEEGKASRLPPGAVTSWRGDFSAIHYVNVPRVAWLAGKKKVPFPEELGRQLHEPVGPLTIPYYAALEELLKRIRPTVISIDRLDDISHVREGRLLAFGNRRLRTRNYRADRPVDRGTSSTSDLLKDPLAYADVGRIRLVMPFDPQFVTSNTAVAEFRSGSLTCAGLCQLKSKPGMRDGNKEVLIASPFVLGLEDVGLL
jgi:hypothetical protein